MRIFGHAKIANIISFASAVFAVLIRWNNTAEEFGMISATGFGKIYVISEQGKQWLIYLIAIQEILSGVVLFDAKNADIEIPKSTWVFAILALALSIAAINLRLSF